MEDIDKLAEEMYDFACANRADNLNKDKSSGDPRKVGCLFKDLMEQSKSFYLNLAKWHLVKKQMD